jgi:hypothetical protein
VQLRVEVIWPTNNRLYSRDGTTRTISKVRVLDKMTNPSPLMREVLPFAVEIIDLGEEKKDCN